MGKRLMQTIEEYKKYTKQLEEEVGTWHRSYDALMVERNDLVKKVMNLESELDKENAIIETLPTQESSAEIDTLASGSRNLNEAIETMAAELEELRKHKLEWELAKARIKELEAKNEKTLEVTHVEVFPFKEGLSLGRVKALATIVLNEQIQVCGLRVMQGDSGLFVSYPNDPFYKGEDLRSIVLPISKELRMHIENAVLEKYQEAATK